MQIKEEWILLPSHFSSLLLSFALSRTQREAQSLYSQATTSFYNCHHILYPLSLASASNTFLKENPIYPKQPQRFQTDQAIELKRPW